MESRRFWHLAKRSTNPDSLTFCLQPIHFKFIYYQTCTTNDSGHCWSDYSKSPGRFTVKSSLCHLLVVLTLPRFLCWVYKIQQITSHSLGCSEGLLMERFIKIWNKAQPKASTYLARGVALPGVVVSINIVCCNHSQMIQVTYFDKEVLWCSKVYLSWDIHLEDGYLFPLERKMQTRRGSCSSGHDSKYPQSRNSSFLWKMSASRGF